MKNQQDKENSRLKRCRFCHRFTRKMQIENHCVADGWEDDKVKTVTEEDCDKCEKFDSKFIEYPLVINGIENSKIDTRGLGHECGCLCEIRPCGEEYEGKSYVGIYLGELPISIITSCDKSTGILSNSTMNNPAIFVPELKKIVYGCESWWREIHSMDDFEGISESEIENTWYVKLLKALTNPQGE